ncbi:MAG: GTP-binding signal recognition particle SRP54 G-domain [Limisphaerales bacterium]|nr:MAG: GTP-binding signal recognition particle SRP54 G-domain [Limisphaerales bacterium]KAG0509263.1 MAG: GTP-binding signal recognition particle SRP54 G-domain [Limisphaerales bacterium]TXT52198.1 MAG: GTP-binding signal recognition particle SRP54 G-domain [Limisphaerales bacterium]
MNTNSDTKLLLKEEVFAVVGSAMEVLNGLGHGLHEKPYENALVVEFGLRKIPCEQQRQFDVLYKGQKVGQFVPDLIAFNAVVVDTKVIDRITDVERGQMLNYLRITKLRVGVILNFKHPKLEWERLVL